MSHGISPSVCSASPYNGSNPAPLTSVVMICSLPCEDSRRIRSLEQSLTERDKEHNRLLWIISRGSLPPGARRQPEARGLKPRQIRFPKSPAVCHAAITTALQYGVARASNRLGRGMIDDHGRPDPP